MLLLFSHLVVSDSFDPKDCSMPGLPVPHHLPKFAQVHIHCIGDSIQPSHPLMLSSPSALNLSQHRWLFHWVGCLHQETKILELQLQHQSFQCLIIIVIFKCTAEWHWVYSHYCTTTTSIQFWNSYMLQNRNSVPINHWLLICPSLSSWQPWFYFLLLWIGLF